MAQMQQPQLQPPRPHKRKAPSESTSRDPDGQMNQYSDVRKAAQNMKDTAYRALNAARAQLDEAEAAVRAAQAYEARARKEFDVAQARLGPALEAANSILASHELTNSIMPFEVMDVMAPINAANAVHYTEEANMAPVTDANEAAEYAEQYQYVQVVPMHASHPMSSQPSAAHETSDQHYEDQYQYVDEYQHELQYQHQPQQQQVQQTQQIPQQTPKQKPKVIRQYEEPNQLEATPAPLQNTSEPPSVAGGIFATLYETFQHEEFNPEKLRDANLGGLTTSGKNKGAAFGRLKDRGYVATHVQNAYRWCIPPPSFWDSLPPRGKDAYYRLTYRNLPDGKPEFSVGEKGVRRKKNNFPE